MAINKKLIHFNYYDDFNSKRLSANVENTKYTIGVSDTVYDVEEGKSVEILYHSICWIKDKLKLWTHGLIYDCNGVPIIDDINDLDINAEQGSLTVVNSEEKVAYSIKDSYVGNESPIIINELKVTTPTAQDYNYDLNLMYMFSKPGTSDEEIFLGETCFGVGAGIDEGVQILVVMCPALGAEAVLLHDSNGINQDALAQLNSYITEWGGVVFNGTMILNDEGNPVGLKEPEDYSALDAFLTYELHSLRDSYYSNEEPEFVTGLNISIPDEPYYTEYLPLVIAPKGYSSLEELINSQGFVVCEYVYDFESNTFLITGFDPKAEQEYSLVTDGIIDQQSLLDFNSILPSLGDNLVFYFFADDVNLEEPTPEQYVFIDSIVKNRVKTLKSIPTANLYIKDYDGWKKFSSGSTLVVNNLDEGGTDVALSAEMGKFLNKKIENIVSGTTTDPLKFKGYVNVESTADIDEMYSLMQVGEACLVAPSIKKNSEDSYVSWIETATQNTSFNLCDALLKSDISKVLNGEIKTYFSLDKENPSWKCPDMLLLAKIKVKIKEFVGIIDMSDALKSLLSLLPASAEITACIGKILRWSAGDWLIKNMENFAPALKHSYEPYNTNPNNAWETGIIAYTLQGGPISNERFTIIVNASSDTDANNNTTVLQIAYGRTGVANGRVWMRIGFGSNWNSWVEITNPGKNTGGTGEIFNDYIDNFAHSDHAHAEGQKCRAEGWNSHAEGYFTVAGGNSHSEGSETKATGTESHAEGYKTTASGNHSHAEGESTQATYFNAHAEGYRTIASGNGAHAEGNTEGIEDEDYWNVASGFASHTEGSGTRAEGDYSHAEGHNTRASGAGAHAEGIGAFMGDIRNEAYGAGSHVEGVETIAAGIGSHAEGIGTLIDIDGGHVQGKFNHTIDAIHVVGIGLDQDNTKDAHVIDDRGRHYILGIGGFEGTNIIENTTLDLATVIENLKSNVPEEYIAKSFTIINNAEVDSWFLIAEITNVELKEAGSNIYGFSGIYNCYSNNSLLETGFIVAKAFLQSGTHYITHTGSAITPYIVRYNPDNLEEELPNRYWLALSVRPKTTVNFVGNSENLGTFIEIQSDSETFESVIVEYAPEPYIMKGIGVNVQAVDTNEYVDGVETNSYLTYTTQSLNEDLKNLSLKNLGLDSIYDWYKRLPENTVTGHQKHLIGAGSYPLRKITNETNMVIQPNIFYDFGTVDNLTISLANPEYTDITNEYMFLFTTGQNTQFECATSVYWHKDLEITPNTSYLISIVNNYATYLDFDLS